MFRKVMLASILCLLVFGISKVVKTSFQTIVTNEVTVSQVEDSDENFIISHNIDGADKIIDLVTIVLLFGIPVFIFRKSIVKLLNGNE